MFNRILSGILVFAMLLLMVPAAVFAADTALRGDFLGTAEKAVYDALAEQIRDVAANGGSTVFDLDVAGKGVNFEILGTDDSGRYIGRYCLDAEQIVLALQNDLPYELYWYDLMSELSFGTKDGVAVGKEPGTVIALKTLVFSFPVAPVYQEVQDEDPQHTLSAQGVEAAELAKANADAVIQEVLRHKKDWSVEQQLHYCFDYIINAAAYEHTQSSNLNIWQMIWVFDEDDSTNVVCEGYAKAFKYLCDGIGVENYLVSGEMLMPGYSESVSSVKEHMWNIVVLDGKSYLVDVTNCDDQSVGAEDKLFLKAPDSGGSEENGYVFTNAHGARFKYDAGTLAGLGGTGILTLHGEDYRDTAVESGPELLVQPNAVLQDAAAVAEISDDFAENILAQAEKNKSTSVVIAPAAVGSAADVQSLMSATFLAALGNKTDADLTVRTPLGDVTIPNGALSAFAGKNGTAVIGIKKSGDQISVTLSVDGAAIAVPDGGMTLLIPCADATPATVAMLVHEDGSREVIRKAAAVNGSLRVPLNGAAAIVCGENAKKFSDVSASAWYADAVAFASSHLLFSGTSETTFAPGATMTRGMLAKVLHNLEGNLEPEFDGSFPDVKAGTWYETAVLWAAGEGIVTGYGNGLYGPNDNITREQLAVMLWRYCGSPESSHSLAHFSDSGKISGYARTAMAWANETGVINGTGDGRLDPSGMATRAQVAQMLKNFLEKT